MVDYKTLRQNLNEESEKSQQQQQSEVAIPVITEAKPTSSRHSSKSISEKSKTPETRPSSRDRGQDRHQSSSSDTKIKPNSGQDLPPNLDNQSFQAMIAQSLMNPQAGLMNAMYGSPGWLK